ncbi:hypothetical protein BGW41_008284 [Actinomortierella wolfii]|nr:hypothetical protein BGW41_008284 [Actinomortierella wolfii]
MLGILQSLRSRHRAMIAHLQKDDSMISLVPYGAGCFLAGGLLIVSGIAETHPKALAIASQLIQIGWWILQMQGLMWVQWMGGSAYQVNTTFQVWVWALQLLDVHRRFLQRVALCEGECHDGIGSIGGSSNNLPSSGITGPRQYYFNMIAQTMLFGTFIVGKLSEWMERLCDWPHTFLTPSSCPQPHPSPSPHHAGFGSPFTHLGILGDSNGVLTTSQHLYGGQEGRSSLWMHGSSDLLVEQMRWTTEGHELAAGGGTMTAMVRWVVFEMWTGLAVCGLMALAWFITGRVQRYHSVVFSCRPLSLRTRSQTCVSSPPSSEVLH